MSLCVSVYVSTLTSTAIAIDRYFAIVHPFRARMTTFCCLAVIAGVWIASITVSLPLGVYMKLTSNVTSANETTVICLEAWPEPGQARRFFTVGR